MSENRGIPTLYAGTRFRSRLEARWAAFFDLAGWRWEYEPIDLDGWIPDFHVLWKNWHQHLIEIKPLTGVSDWEMIFEAAIKIGRANPQLPTIIVGAVCPIGTDNQIGWLRPKPNKPNLPLHDLPEWTHFCFDDDSFIELWREAGNRVQWMAPTQRPYKTQRNRPA